MDSDDANKSISKTEGKAEGLGKKLGNGIKTAAKWGAAIGAGALAAGGAMMGMATKAAATTDRIDKLSQKIGLSRQGFQEWEFILSQSGMDVDKLQTGLKTLNQRMDETMLGTGKGAELFQKLGVSVKDNTGALKTQEQVFEETVQKLQEMPDGAEKARLATELFGKAGQELMPLLNGAAGSVDEMKKKAHELGLVLSDDAIDSGVAFTDTMDQLKRAMQTAFTTIGVTVMPLIQGFAQWVIANMPTIQKVFQTVFSAIQVVFSTAVEWIQSLIAWLGEWRSNNESQLTGIWNTFKEKLTLIWQYVQESFGKIKVIVKVVIETVSSFVKTQLEGIMKFWKENGDSILKATKTVFESIRATIEFIMPIVTTIIKVAWNLIKTIISSAINIVMGLIQVFAGALTGDFSKMKDGLLRIWKALWDLIKGVVSGAWTLLSGAFSALSRSISNWFTGLKKDAVQWGKNMIQGFIDGIIGMIGKVKSTVSNVMETIGDFIGFNSPAKKGEGRNIVKWGRNMIDGFLDGVEDEGKRMGNVMDRLVGSMTPTQPFIKGVEKVEMSNANASTVNSAPTQNTFPIHIEQMVVREEADIHRIARELFQLQREKARGAF